jgi:hypothetical protein
MTVNYRTLDVTLKIEVSYGGKAQNLFKYGGPTSWSKGSKLTM